jgi:E3 ubiquitin-protein ligase SIAH1
MVCSKCKEKMAAAKKCHVCRRALSGGYKRCFGAEHILECIRVPCPNKAYGCSVMLARYEESEHLKVCQQRPFHCPAEGCTFAARQLLNLREHFASVHRWPSTEASSDVLLYTATASLAVVDGFNVVMMEPWFHPPQLVLLKVKPESLGRVVTPTHILRHPTTQDTSECRFKLEYQQARGSRRLEYAFNVVSSDISSSGVLSSPHDFVLPKSLQPLDVDTFVITFTCEYPDED